MITRAVAQNEQAAALHGWRPVRIEAANWALASLLAGLAGVLAAPIVSLSPSTMTLAVVPALAAALVAQFSSFPIAAAAGLAIGVGQSLCIKAAADWSWFPQQGMAETLRSRHRHRHGGRGRRLPTRGEPIGGHLPGTPSQALAAPAHRGGRRRRLRLVVATQRGGGRRSSKAWSLRLPVVRRAHRLRRPGLLAERVRRRRRFGQDPRQRDCRSQPAC